MEPIRANPYPLRLPPPLRLRLQNEADKNGRTLHREIVWRLEKSVGEKQQEKPQ